MPYNLYGGVACFGLAVKMLPMIAPRATQVNAYPALNGLELIDLGARGGTTSVTGRIFGTTVPNLIVAKSLLESFNDNVARDFYDSSGNYWTNVIMGPVRPVGRFSPGGIGYTWGYEVELLHLVY